MHAQCRKNIAVFRHVANACMSDFKTPQTGQLPALPDDVTRAVHQSHDGFGRGGSARAVAPQQGHNFARLQGKTDTVQYVTFAIEGL